jgi:hypothetical protein
MTHTLHRTGTKNNLSNDYVVFAMSGKGINENGSAAKMQEFLRMASRHKPVNMGDMKTGNTFVVTADDVLANVKDTSIVHAVFTDLETVAKFVREVKDANLGISVVISGLFDAAKECCQKTKLPLHTIEHSLGIWGKKEKLSSPSVLEVTTMCGHGMVAANLVDSLAKEIAAGKTTPEKGAEELAKQCCCGVFNPVRGAALLKAMAKK